MKSLSVPDYRRLAASGMGLVVGPGATCGGRAMAEMTRDLIAQDRDLGGVPAFLAAGTELQRRGDTPQEISNRFRDFLRDCKPVPDLPTLAATPWRGVASFCLDQFFDHAVEEAHGKNPLARNVAVLAPGEPMPGRATPLFRMLCVNREGDLACTELQYGTTKPRWVSAMRALADRLRSAPLLVTGLEGMDRVLQDFLFLLASEPMFRPSCLVFRDGDGFVNSEWLGSTLDGLGLESRLVVATRGELARASSKGAGDGMNLSLPLGDPVSQAEERLRGFADLMVCVNVEIVRAAGLKERAVLLDQLFAPARPAWGPFLQDYDLRRSVGPRVLGLAKELLKSATPAEPRGIQVMGSAAVGKTTILKRCAMELARSGELVVWLRPWSYQDLLGLRQGLMRALGEVAAFFAGRVAVFVDDPGSFAVPPVPHLWDAANELGIRMLVVTALRPSDAGWESSSQDPGAWSSFVVEDTFEQDEWDALPGYLVAVGACANPDAARAALTERGVRANDVLCTLYFALPETRASIQKSILDEYLRLDGRTLMRGISERLGSGSSLLRRAYEFVAVAEKFRAPVPVEVMVSALKVPYGDWLEQEGDGGPAGGLLYADDQADGEALAYRPRNEVVAREVRRILNGGLLAFGGEYRALGQLLAACTGSQPVYREFCVQVLCRNTEQALSDFNYDEGLALFDLAEGALPYADKTLRHHRGIWMKNKGNDARGALRVLEEALTMPPYPYAARAEVDSHIHTTRAAAFVRGLESGQIPLAEAQKGAFECLEKARKDRLWDPMAMHVEANLVLKVVRQHGRDGLWSAGDALAWAEATLSALEEHRLLARESAGSVALKPLEEVGVRLVEAIAEWPVHPDDAEGLWAESHRQEGFVAHGRSLLLAAQKSKKGKDYRDAFDFVNGARARVADQGGSPSIGLTEICAQIFYEWRVLTREDTVDWALLHDLAAPRVRQRGDARACFYRYLQALAAFHLHRWAEAEGLFRANRSGITDKRVLWSRRDFLRNEGGGRRVVQGVVRRGGERAFLISDDLGVQVLLDRRDADSRKEGATIWREVVFAFGGPLAVSGK